MVAIPRGPILQGIRVPQAGPRQSRELFDIRTATSSGKKQDKLRFRSLADELGHPTFSRGRTFFGYAGDEIDQSVGNYPNMRWWVADQGLVVAVLHPDEILRKPRPIKLIEQRAAQRQAVVMPILEELSWRPGTLASKAGVGKELRLSIPRWESGQHKGRQPPSSR